MPSLSVRNLTDDTYDALRRRAAAAGRSMEAEARLVLEKAANEVSPPRLPSAMSDAERKAFVEGLRQRRLARSGGRVLPDSTPLIRQDRDSR